MNRSSLINAKHLEHYSSPHFADESNKVLQEVIRRVRNVNFARLAKE